MIEPNSIQLFTEPTDLHLENNQVQVWQAWLDCSTQELTRYDALLSVDEKARAGRFHFEKDRNHYIVCRGLLRLILSTYLDIKPTQVEFSYGRYRKPALKTGLGIKDLEFNLSHSKDLGVFAFCLERPIGIDVEYIRPMPDEDRFAEQFFSTSETAWITAHDGLIKQDGFFKIWTCKEAFFKVSGDGLTLPISQAIMELDNSQSIHLAAINGRQSDAARWKIISYEPAAGYQAALAVEGQDWQVSFGWLSPLQPACAAPPR